MKWFEKQTNRTYIFRIFVKGVFKFNPIMKTLYLLRHAKSSWNEHTDDHQRKLKKRGIEDAKLMATEISKMLPPPEIMISSDAERAESTARIFQKAWDLEEENFVLENQLYEFQGGAVLKYIKTLDERFNRVMLVGHNYALTAVVNFLSQTAIEDLPTCGFVVLKFNTDEWSSVSRGEIKITLFPRHL